MKDIIQLLPESLANQIAAGEVVQRPASVVKELLENAIDAGATSIKLLVKDAGKQLIQVIDNGKGMSETDARMCFERHATSKIKTTEDLFSILTYGFRGEAMASIAAVAQVELKTKRANDEIGTHIKIENSQIQSTEAIAMSVGTQVLVKNLFFNVPARRNFLKSTNVELRHITEEFQRVALAYPSIAMSLRHNDLDIWVLPEAKLIHRIVALFGKSYQEQLMPCKEDTELLKINGYIGKPDASKKSRGEQYFFVNNRFIKSNYLNHAVMTAYKNLVGVDVFPLYVLFLEIDPKHIDINVHPTKTEIKFDDERTIYHLIMASVRKSLGIFNVVPSIDFGLNVNFDPFTTAHSQGNTIPKHNDSKAFSFIDKYPSQQERNNQAHWQSLYQGFDNESTSHQPTERIASRVNVLSLPISDDLVTAKPEPKNCIQVQQKYIIAKLKSGLLIVNQQAASERILFERFQQSLLQKSGTSQQNLFPFTIELNPSDYQLVMEIDAQIRNLGFDFSAFSSNTIVVNGIPADVKNTNEKELFIGLIEQYKMYGSDIKLDINEKLARSMAKRSAIKTGQLLSNEEMDILIDQLFGCAMPHTDPAGKPAYTILDLGKIESLF